MKTSEIREMLLKKYKGKALGWNQPDNVYVSAYKFAKDFIDTLPDIVRVKLNVKEVGHQSSISYLGASSHQVFEETFVTIELKRKKEKSSNIWYVDDIIVKFWKNVFEVYKEDEIDFEDLFHLEVERFKEFKTKADNYFTTAERIFNIISTECSNENISAYDMIRFINEKRIAFKPLHKVV